MDACGIIVAASEVIRLDRDNGILLTVYNEPINLYFYILATGNSVQLWKKVYVTHFYLFSHLKIGAIELLSGTKKIVLVTSSSSTFQEIVENQLQKCTISSLLIKKLSVPGISFDSILNSFSQVISYQGVVTKVKNSNLGLYQLDNKVDLYCIFNSSCALLTTLKKGSEVFVSNAHFLTDIEARKILVCCGLSSVRLLQDYGESVEDTSFSYFDDIHRFPLSIFDVIWLDALLTTLSSKFCPSVIGDGNTFHWESIITHNILDSFSDLSCVPSSVKQSIGDEYCSYPHKCSVFCDDILPTGLKVPLICELVDKASCMLSLMTNSDNWKTKCVQNDTTSILIGMFYLSKDGCWYVSDNSCTLPIILTRCCTDCNSSKNMLCSFSDLNLGYLVAVQNFVTVFEKIKYKSGQHIYHQYFKTSCCFLIQLGTFYKQKDSTYLSSQENFNFDCASVSSITEISHMLEYTHLDKKDLWTTPETYSSTSFNNKGEIHNSASQHILVLSKIWTVIDKAFVCYQILVLLLPHEEIYEEYHNLSRSVFDDSNNYYETDDDLDFAKLVDRMDSLFLEDKPRLARLHFESAKQCSVLLPGHIYVMDFTENFGKDMKFYVSSVKNSLKPYLIKIKPEAKIIHSFKCLGNHSLDDYRIDAYCDIMQIVSERKVKENSVIRAILVDKLYEEPVSSSCGSPSDVTESMTFCLIVKDVTSKDTIRVYLRVCPRNMYGFLPSVTLQLYGFICACSKRGNPYLIPSSAYALQVVHSSEFFDIDERMVRKSTELSSGDLKLAQLTSIPTSEQFKCLCFLIKITSAKLGLVCNSCLKDFEDKCSCLGICSPKLTVNFLIDDGTNQAIAVSSGETARNILLLSEREWKSLISYIEEARIPLMFHYKTVNEKPHASSYINKVFSVLCSSQFLCRQMLLKCQRKYGSPKADLQSVWCHDVLSIQETDLIPELIVKVKYSNT